MRRPLLSSPAGAAVPARRSHAALVRKSTQAVAGPECCLIIFVSDISVGFKRKVHYAVRATFSLPPFAILVSCARHWLTEAARLQARGRSRVATTRKTRAAHCFPTANKHRDAKSMFQTLLCVKCLEVIETQFEQQ